MNAFQRLMIPVQDMLEKARRYNPKLVQRTITVTNKDGTTFTKRAWVDPTEKDAEKPKNVQFDLFGGDDAPILAVSVEKKAGSGTVNNRTDTEEESNDIKSVRQRVFNAMKREGYTQKEADYSTEFKKRVSDTLKKKAEISARNREKTNVLPVKGPETTRKQVELPEIEGEKQAVYNTVHETQSSNRGDLDVSIVDTDFRDYGSWSGKGKNLNPAARGKLNQEVAELLLKSRDSLTEEDKGKIQKYSGFGGVKAADERGVLYDFYTSPPVAKMAWKMLDKIVPVQAGESVLEPSCGSGVFFDVTPAGVEKTGVELDTRTAAVASILQEGANIHTGSFEQFNMHNTKRFSRVIGNAPFGDRSVTTSFMDMPEEKSLDKYFISRSIDALVDGGSMGLIVHPGVLDGKSNRDWRAELQKKGQFMGAVRLPNGSFKHTQTGVQPDMLFFRKYPEEVQKRLDQLDESGLKEAGFWHEGWVEGTYYDENKAHILGELNEGGGNWGSDVVEGDLSLSDMDKAIVTFNPEPDKTTDDLDKLNSMTTKPAGENKKVESMLTESEAEAVACKTLSVGMTKSIDGKVYRLNENHRWELVKGADETTSEKLEKVKAIAEKVKAIREAMHNDEPVDDLQREARTLLQDYKDEHGTNPMDDKDVKRLLTAHASLSGVYEGLVDIDDDILNKQNVYAKEIDLVDGHNPAVTALLTLQKNMLEATPANIQSYFPNDIDALMKELQDNKDCFLTPDGGWELREDFIAGDAWVKIDALKSAIEEHDGDKWVNERVKWQAGITDLEAAVGWTSIEEAEFTPQSSWIPEEIINKWAKDPDGMAIQYALADKILSRNEEGKWGVKGTKDKYIRPKNWRDDGETIEAGTWYPLNDEIAYFLNLQKQRSKNIDTETYDTNARENFKNWVANNPNVRMELEALFNRKFNCDIGTPTKTYSVKIDGWNPSVILGGHQWQTIHHLYRAGKGITALGTGFGKTLASVGLMALLRQEGKVKRPMVQVPNNKVKDWVKTFAKAMPGLKVGSVDPESEGYGNQVKRYKMYQDLANGDYDVIILPESSATEIQLSEEEDARITSDVVSAQIMDKTAGKSDRKVATAKESALGKMQNGKTNKTISFEDLGCDALFVDEAHNYKNLFSSTLSRETGMNDGRRSDRAMSLFKKSEFIRHSHDGKNVFLCTATPLTNSPLEYYNMLMHVAPEMLTKLSIHNIDDFIRNFADIETGMKCDWGSGKAKEGRILKGFKNLRSLQDMFFKYTDLQNDSTKIGLAKPSANNVPNVIPMQKEQTEELRDISAQLEEFKNASKDEKAAKYEGENYLTFYSRMRTASLDLELYDPVKYKGWKNPKLEKLAQNAMDSFTATSGGQVIFCDRVLSGDGSMNMHDKIKAELVAKGFKESEIVVVNGTTKTGGAKSDSALEHLVSEAIDGFNTGKYKVIIGTTPTLGEGVNLQKNSAALHHFDIPYRPSDFIQRNGRIDRQGNKQGDVALHTYLSAGTIDNYSVNLVQNKANWIDQLLKTKSNVFMNPNDDSYVDPDELLLALTEEWGDKDKAGDRRAEMNKIKADKIQEANQNKVHDMMGALSQMRGSINGYQGDKGTVQYQNRVRKIQSIEDSLRNNTEFKNLDLLAENPPDFIYDKKKRRAYQKGDKFMLTDGIFEVKSINHKNQKMVLVGLDGATSTEWSASDGLYGNYSYKGKANDEEIKKLQTLYSQNEYAEQTPEFKKDNYKRYMSFVKIRPQDLIFEAREDTEGKIRIGRVSSYTQRDRTPSSLINPYEPEGRSRIEAYLKGNDHENMDASAASDPVFKELGLSEGIKTAVIADYHAKPESKFIDAEVGSTWVSAKSIAEKMNVALGNSENDKVREYDIKNVAEMHPDYETDYERIGRDYDWRIRRKSVEKAIKSGYLKPQKLLIMGIKR